MTTHIPSLTLPAYVFANPAASILLPLTLGNAIGYANSKSTAQRYKALRQPPLRPPPWLFAPVWSALYAAMGYASWRAWRTGTSAFAGPATHALARQGATLYTLQLGLNLAWMPLFFGLGKPVAASADIVALLGTTSYLTYVWSQVDEVAAWVMVPYIGWLSFATYLCVGCGYLNNWDFSSAAAEHEKSS